MLYIGSDHRGYELKEELKNRLRIEGIDFEDMGPESYNPDDDYADYALSVSKKVLETPENKGVLICGSGVGMDMTANKIHGIRSCLVTDEKRAVQSREHEDANVVALPSDILIADQAFDIVKAFLTTDFSGDARHLRRLKKMEEIERGQGVRN